jgi:type I restriction enzyme S subunit
MYGATVGEIGITSHEAACNQAICAFLPNETYPFSFIYEFLLFNKQEIISKAVGSAQQNISQQMLLQYELVIPPIETLKNFAKIVEPVFLQIKLNIEESKILSQLRESLLSKLMKGEIEI